MHYINMQGVLPTYQAITLTDYLIHMPANSQHRIRHESPALSVPYKGIILPLRTLLTTIIQDTYFPERLYSDLTLFTVMFPGDEHIIHADNCTEVNGKWIGNHTPWRTYFCSLSLGTCGKDYTGGEFEFVNQQDKIAMTTGQLIAAPAGHEFTHRVHKVNSGKRINMLMWFTDDIRHDDSSRYREQNAN